MLEALTAKERELVRLAAHVMDWSYGASSGRAMDERSVAIWEFRKAASWVLRCVESAEKNTKGEGGA